MFSLIFYLLLFWFLISLFLLFLRFSLRSNLNLFFANRYRFLLDILTLCGSEVYNNLFLLLLWLNNFWNNYLIFHISYEFSTSHHPIICALSVLLGVVRAVLVFLEVEQLVHQLLLLLVVQGVFQLEYLARNAQLQILEPSLCLFNL